MGNSNSSAVQVGPAKWTQSLEPPDARNRMKRSYFPPRHYGGRQLPPQKVLPALNSAKGRRLKPTSNGAILHGGGTISGRKLLNELDLTPARKTSPTADNDNEDTGISGEDDGGPVTLISESPAQKQIRAKKKGPAPAPPPGDGAYYRASQPEPKRSHSRIFKTKAESRTKTLLALELERKLVESRRRKTEEPVSRWLERKENHHEFPADFSTRKLSSLPPVTKSVPGASGTRIQSSLLPDSPVPKSKAKPQQSASECSNNSKSGAKGPDNSHKAKVSPSEEPSPRKSFYFGMDEGREEKVKGQAHPEPVGPKSKTGQTHSSRTNEPTGRRNSNNRQYVPESDSDGLHTRQDSGNFELPPSERGLRANPVHSHAAPILESWSSDLSSSEMDIPLMLRPTLPLKRQELPRFSPSAAWRALDSPRASERSLSSEDGFRYEEGHIQRYKRQAVPPQRSTQQQPGHRSGDSGISAGDGASPANALPDLLTSQQGKQKDKTCWTPEQDLDESSSEDLDSVPPAALPIPARDRDLRVPLSVGPLTPPKLTTRSHLFSKKEEGPPLYARSTKAKVKIPESLEGKAVRRSGGLDPNWFLSRSEPNSLNAPDLMLAQAQLSLPPEEDEAGWSLTEPNNGSLEVSSDIEIGYGPSSMNFYRKSVEEYDLSPSNSWILSHIMYLPAYDSRRAHAPFSGSRRSRSVDNLDVTETTAGSGFRISNSNTQQQKQTQYSKAKQAVGRTASGSSAVTEATKQAARKKFKFQSTLRVLERKRIEQQLAREAEEQESERRREQEVMREVEAEFERKRAREKLDKERAGQWDTGSQNHKGQGLVSVGQWDSTGVQSHNHKGLLTVGQWDNMGQTQTHNHKGQDKGLVSVGQWENGGQGHKGLMSVGQWENSGQGHKGLVSVGQWESGSHNYKGGASVGHWDNMGHKGEPDSTSGSLISSSSLNGNGNGLGSKPKPKYTTKINLSQRTEPEGAPASYTYTASSPSIDLRKELIHASRKRNGVGVGSDLTQELSEFRQTTRQYCDYRRSPRTNSASPARFAESSSSDIYPVSCSRGERSRNSSNSGRHARSTTTTIHPEVVCDIPSKPFPYMVNFSRHSGSTSNLLIEERPGSGLGGQHSGPSSVISDNYRRDWAHNRSTNGSVLGGRASSIVSLHSPSDHFRHSSSSDLNVTTSSPKIMSKSRKSPVSQKYSSSPASSPVPAASSNSSNGSSLGILEKGTKGLPSSGAFQPQPFNSNKAKGYRPVVFKPNPSPHLTSSTSVI